MNSFLSQDEIKKIGFKKVGNNCLISRFANFYNVEKIEIGNNVRIDDFCILSGEIKLGSYIHISAYSALYGSKGIVMKDYSGLSPRTTIYSATDDFSGNFLINPTIPSQFTNVTGGEVVMNRFVQLGANTIVMPNLTIGEGTVTGAFTLVTKTLKSWKIYKGIPASILRERSKKMLYYVNRF